MKIVKQSRVKIADIVRVLRAGSLVIMPTETVYGAMVDAANPVAVKKLNEYKARPFGKPFSVAVSDQKMAQKYVELNPTARNLYKTFLPGPLTVVSKGKHQVAAGIESETGTLGIRIPAYQLVIEVVKKLGRPVTATSANAAYQKRPYKIANILENLSAKQKALIDLVVDAGELPHNEPSTVIDTTLDDPAVLRQGEIKLKDKNEVLSRSEESTRNIAKELWQKYQKYQGQRAIVFALEGEMGAGKTVFTKGLARAMGIKEEVVSPTFQIEIEYGDRERRLYHFDAWRLQSGQELEDLGLKGLISDKSVIALEWADRVAPVIRRFNEEAVVIWVKIKYLPAGKAGGKKENERWIGWGVV